MPEDTLALHRRYTISRSPRDLEQLVCRYRGLAGALARRYARPGAPIEDLEQVACLGLVKALRRFDPDRGCAFTTFAVPTILGELRQFCRQVLWPVHVPRLVQERVAAIRRITDETVAARGRAPTAAELAARLGCDEEAVVEALQARSCFVARSLDSGASPDATEPPEGAERWLATEERGFQRVENRALLEEALGRLTDTERELVRLRFVDELTHRQIGARMRMSASQVGRLLQATVDRLGEVATPVSAAHGPVARRRPRRAQLAA